MRFFFVHFGRLSRVNCGDTRFLIHHNHLVNHKVSSLHDSLLSQKTKLFDV